VIKTIAGTGEKGYIGDGIWLLRHNCIKRLYTI